MRFQTGAGRNWASPWTNGKLPTMSPRPCLSELELVPFVAGADINQLAHYDMHYGLASRI